MVPGAVSTVLPPGTVGTGGRSQYGFAAAQPNSVVRLRPFGYLKLVLGDPHYSWQFIDEAGNDYPVYEMGVASVPVHGWPDTPGRAGLLGVTEFLARQTDLLAARLR